MILVLIGKDLLLEAKQRTNRFQVYIYIHIPWDPPTGRNRRHQDGTYIFNPEVNTDSFATIAFQVYQDVSLEVRINGLSMGYFT